MLKRKQLVDYLFSLPHRYIFLQLCVHSGSSLVVRHSTRMSNWVVNEGLSIIVIVSKNIYTYTLAPVNAIASATNFNRKHKFTSSI